MKKNILTILFSVLLLINVTATVFLTVKVLKAEDTQLDGATAHYTLYIGTNDKDTYEQIIPTEEAKHIVDEICAKYVGGLTVQDAIGSWADESGTITHENTIVCYLDDIDEDLLHRICDEIRLALNQNTVLIQKEYTLLDFYAGEGGK